MDMHSRWPRAVLLCSSLLFPILGFAQEVPSPTYAEQIEVRIIDVDVVVTDENGRPITGLRREDFELFEDGKPVEIRYFTAAADMIPAPAPGAAAEAPAPAVAAKRDPAAAPVTFVVFIDQTSMHPSRRNRTLRHLRTFLESTFVQGDRGLIASNDGLALRVRQNITNDRAVLLDTLTKLEKERVHQGPMAARATQIRHDIRVLEPEDRKRRERGEVREERALMGTDDPEFYLAAVHIGAQIAVLVEEEAHRTRNSIRAMGALVDVLAGVEGRLALVYVGAGFNTLPGLELTEVWRTRFPFLEPNPGSPRPEDHKHLIQQDIDKLYANLSATRVTVYTIHASGVAGASAEEGGILAPEGLVPGDRSQAYETGLAREMAERTGGVYFKINPDLVKQLERVRLDLSHYYSLGYVPKGTPGKEHGIKVRVKAKGARVRHRETVRERTRSEEAGRAQVASMVQPKTRTPVQRVEATTPALPPTEANPLGVQVEAARPQRDGWGKEYLLPFNLELGSLTFVPKGSIHRAEFVLHFAIVEPNGTVWPIESREHSLQINADEVPKGDDAQMSLRWHVDLAPLRIPPEVPMKTEGLKLTVTVEDRGSNARSVVTVPVQKPGGAYFGEN